MTESILYILSSFVLSIACGFIFIPLIMNFCKKKGLYDPPDGRKVHKNAVPRLGGISFMPSMLLASLVAIAVYNQDIFGSKQLMISPWSVGFFVSLLLIYGVGIVDDLVGLGAGSKFTVQIIAGVLLTLSGLYINNLYGFCGINEVSYAIGAPLTIFAIVFISNAINLIDGIDGLSAGLSFIALTGFLLCFLREGNMTAYCILIAGLMGVLIPFLYFNIFGKVEKNQKIFMGDSGSLTLGFILGFLFVKYTMDEPDQMSFQPDAMMLASSLLVVPVLDVMRVSIIRIMHHTPIFQADKNHIHHKLMRAGLNQHQALITILGLSLLYIVVNISLWPWCNLTALTLIDLMLWLVFHNIVDIAIRHNGQPVFLKNITQMG